MLKSLIVTLFLFLIYFLNVVLAAPPIPKDYVLLNNKTQSIEQYGVTWTFAAPVEYGKFANGDYWVLDPGAGVIISKITPATFIEEGFVRHGSMINPSPIQGGNTGYGTITYHTYVPDLNIEESLPKTVTSGSSVVSVISYTIADPRPQNSYIKAAAVLTVLGTVPPEGSFRPPYSGSDKIINYNKTDLDYSRLKSLPRVAETPSLAIVEAAFQRPWIDHTPGHRAQRVHPVENMPEYGAWLHDRINVAALMLNLNFSNAEKENLLIYFTQLGIDLFGITQESNTTWYNDGGHAGGRKLPIMFAGLLLANSDMLAIAAKSGDYLNSNDYGPGNPPPDYIHFGEDDQTHYVTQLDVDITNGNHATAWKPSGEALTSSIWLTYDHGGPYTSGDIGTPEYGIRHSTAPEWNTKQWDTYKNYRNIPDRPLPMTALVGRIMEIKSIWNHNALFDYADRRVSVTGNKGGWWYGTFQANMWDTYRKKF